MMNQGVQCPICGDPVSFRPSYGRRSGKPFIMLICPQDGRHLRAFITYQPYVKEVMQTLGSRAGTPEEQG